MKKFIVSIFNNFYNLFNLTLYLLNDIKDNLILQILK